MNSKGLIVLPLFLLVTMPEAGSGSGLVGRVTTFSPETGDESYRISFVNGFSIDTREGTPSLPDRLRIDEPGPGRLLRIVQFSGPLRQEWMRELEQMGIRVFGYLPNYAVLAMMEPAQCEAVPVLGCVNWVGTFQPAYKIQQALLDATGIRELAIAITPGEESAPVREAIARLG
ncbi:MAG: hypothetical protein ABIK62_02150, partial [candidate division WOR-3 bacterium]